MQGKAVIRPIAFRPTPTGPFAGGGAGGGKMSGASTPTNGGSACATPCNAGFRPINAGAPGQPPTPSSSSSSVTPLGLPPMTPMGQQQQQQQQLQLQQHLPGHRSAANSNSTTPISGGEGLVAVA